MISTLQRKLLTIALSKIRKVRTIKITKQVKMSRLGLCAVVIGVIALCIILYCLMIAWGHQKSEKMARVQQQKLHIEKKYLQQNEFSRPGIALKQVNGIVVHYTANPGADAMANRNYFNDLPNSNKEREKNIYASSHFIIGLEGEIIQCVPLEEVAYASNERNHDTISIECCHKKKNGKFEKKTYETLVELVTYLCLKYDIKTSNVIRHHDVTGKICPKYFVEHKDKWAEFLIEVENRRAAIAKKQ